jgi:hypothetical protein
VEGSVEPYSDEDAWKIKYVYVKLVAQTKAILPTVAYTQRNSILI